MIQVFDLLSYPLCAFIMRGQLMRNHSDHNHLQSATACFDRKITSPVFNIKICKCLVCFHFKKCVHYLQHFGY